MTGLSWIRAKTKEVTVIPQPINLQVLIKEAIHKGANIETMERLLAMRDKLRAEQAEEAFREAMSQFQAGCPIINKSKKVMNKDGSSIRYKYAPIDDIVREIQPLLTQTGLSYDIDTVIEKDPAGITVIVSIFHLFGHSKETRFFVPIDDEAYMNDQQKWASAQTFAKRYAFCNGFGILTGDDDDDTITVDDTVKQERPAKKKIDMKACPLCGVEAIITNKYGGNYAFLCWPKKKGCGTKFDSDMVKMEEAPKTPPKTNGTSKEEALKKIEALPDRVKELFKGENYSSEDIWQFCLRHNWNHEKMISEIEFEKHDHAESDRAFGENELRRIENRVNDQYQEQEDDRIFNKE